MYHQLIKERRSQVRQKTFNLELATPLEMVELKRHETILKSVREKQWVVKMMAQSSIATT